MKSKTNDDIFKMAFPKEKRRLLTSDENKLMDLARIEERKEQKDLLDECRLQLEYLNNKFGETGTTNALLSKLNILTK